MIIELSYFEFLTISDSKQFRLDLPLTPFTISYFKLSLYVFCQNYFNVISPKS